MLTQRGLKKLRIIFSPVINILRQPRVMPAKRDSLRVWLEKNLNANKIRGLEWKDKGRRIFRIRWKHASKHGWSSEVDGCVFREWAIYSGKFKPGEKGKEEPKVWKANFRCALNALPDIVENVAERETRGNDAQKVFEMKPHMSRHGKRSRGNGSLRYRNTSSSYQGITCVVIYITTEPPDCHRKSFQTRAPLARPSSKIV